MAMLHADPAQDNRIGEGSCLATKNGHSTHRDLAPN